MYSKFKLDNFNEKMFSLYYEEGKKIYDDSERKILCTLKDVTDDGIINGTLLQNNWFPVLNKYDVFLCHYHDDEKLAIGLAGFLKTKLGLDVFIDSCLWGYSNKLLHLIDEKYCRGSNNSLFDYEKRNYSTSHVHMMLSTALSNMINECEAVFFLNSSKKTSIEKDIHDGCTISPWIYHELVMSNLIKVRPISDYRSENYFRDHRSHDIANESYSSLHIEYDVTKELNEFVPLESKDLCECITKWQKNEYKLESSLDYLYMKKKKLHFTVRNCY